MRSTLGAEACAEAGANTVFVNWRGFFAAPGIPEARADAYRRVLAAMYDEPAWHRIRDRNGWVDIYRPGPEFTAMLNEQERIIGSLMRELGLL